MKIINKRLVSGDSEYKTFGDIMRQYENKAANKPSIIFPQHQRDKRWDKEKSSTWIDILKTAAIGQGQKISGTIVLYYLKNEYDKMTLDGKMDLTVPLKINDGGQRTIHSITRYINNCKETGGDPYALLDNVGIYAQLLIYDTPEVAFNDFFLINSVGTTCTPKELTKGLISIHFEDTYETVWEPKLKRISEIISNCLRTLGCKVDNVENLNCQSDKRTATIHKRLRDDLGLFFRFASKDKTRRSYETAKAVLKPEDLDSTNLVEKNLVPIFKQYGSVKTDALIDRFEKFCINWTGFHKQHWISIIGNGYAPSNTWFRYWLNTAIHFHNNNFKKEEFTEFTQKLIKEGEGKTTLNYMSLKGKKCHVNLATGTLGQLPTVCFAIGINDKFTPKEKRQKGKNLEPGFTNSHILPISKNGDGPTLPENTVDNISRGACIMESNKVQELQEFVEKGKNKDITQQVA